MNVISFLRGDKSLLPHEIKMREVFLYIIFGGLTTLVNTVSFVSFDKIFTGQFMQLTLAGQPLDTKVIINTTVAWIIAVLFAFITNRTLVFRSHGPVFKELTAFVTSRIATLIVFENGFLLLGIWILEQGMGINKDSAALLFGSFSWTYLYNIKLLIAVFVVIGNYILSKIFVFRGTGAKKFAEDIASTNEESDKNVEQ